MRDRNNPAASSTPPEAKLSKDLERIRHRGYGGGFITRHRALLFSPHNPAKMIPAFLLAVAFLLGWYLLRDQVCRFWSVMMDFWAGAVGMHGGVSAVKYYLFEVIPFSIPFLSFGAGPPSDFVWWVGLIFTALLVVLSFLIPRQYLPLAYMLRITAFFQSTAQIFFYFWRYGFPYEASGYVHGMLIASWMFISIVPIVLGFTYFIFDFSLSRKIALAVVIMGHQTILVPMQYVMQAYVIHHTSLLFLPLCFFVSSLPLNVVIFIAFFGWGFSWKDMLYQEAVQWKVRGRAY
jgi:hypothetical protein